MEPVRGTHKQVCGRHTPTNKFVGDTQRLPIVLAPCYPSFVTHFFPAHDPDARALLRGIYPILNVAPDTDLESLLDWALRLPDAGVSLVQVRAKGFADEALPLLLDELIGQLRGSGLAVVLNDLVELVGVTGAEGVHVGIDDFPVFNARAILGPRAIVGATVRNHAEALLAIGQGASYVAAGSVFPSPTKPGAPVIGLEGLRSVVEHVKSEGPHRPGWGPADSAPVCAIGGIALERLADIYKTGASMAAVISAIQDADDPVEAARKMVEEWERLEMA